MHPQAIPLADLHAHPANSNVMPAALLAKLVGHLERTGQYPPIIVRARPAAPAPDAEAGGYEILDGHHRVEALRRLGADAARCVVWEVDDEGALVLLATLNRLQGRDDPRRRAALLAELGRTLDGGAMAARLPEDAARIRRTLELNEKPAPPRLPRAISEMPVAVHFFLLPAERDRLEGRLSEIGGGREAALMVLAASRKPLAVGRWQEQAVGACSRTRT